MSNLKMKEFLDDAVATYAVYKVVQQIPGFIDTVSQTQRKILYVMSELPNKKVKTAETFTMIYNKTKYRHGDTSVYTTAENLAAAYNNGISLLKPEGTFGSRTVKKASSPRYTSLVFGKASQNIFNSRDFPLMEKQYTEGKLIEPYNMLPIIPLGLINGADGIGLGFSCKIFQRNPNHIINLIIDILSGKRKEIPPVIKPDFPFFNGSIEKGEGNSQFIITGNFKKLPRNTIEITELPISLDREKYIKFLETLKDSKKIKSFTDECKKNTFYFKIKVDPEIYNLSESKIIDLFKLKETVSDSITLLHRENGKYKILTYNSVSEFLKAWIIERFGYYNLRKEYELKHYENRLIMANEKIRFIYCILDEKIIVNRKSKVDIEKQIIDNDFKPMSNDSQSSEEDKNFKYLLNMPIYNLSLEQIEILKKQKDDIEKEIGEFSSLSPANIWIDELKALKKIISKEQKTKEL
jgi:DNA topoisomerase-2